MGQDQLSTELARAKLDAGKLANLMRKNPELIPSVFQELSNKSAGVKFSCSKSLVLLSETDPDLLCPGIEKVFDLLGCENRILKWNAIAMLGNLAAAGRIDPIGPALRKLYQFLTCGELIAANHAVSALGKIGQAFPTEQTKITSRLLAIEHAPFETDECRNIVIGKCIQAMGVFLSPDDIPKNALEFVRRQTGNRRRATAEKAKAFLRKFGS
jgi:hypothetical protein